MNEGKAGGQGTQGGGLEGVREREQGEKEEKGQNRKESKKKGQKRGTLKKENHRYPKTVVSN